MESPGSHAKLARARDLLASLRGEVGEPQHRPHVIQYELIRETMERRAVFYALEPVPLAWSVLIGEMIHDLRSALDHLVYVLTLAHSGAEVSNSEYPIFDEADLFHQVDRKGVPTRSSGLHKIRGVSPEARALIEESQPFKVAALYPGQVSILSVLRDLSNIDKHRTLHLCRLMNQRTTVRVLVDIGNSVTLYPPRVLEQGTEVARWTIAPNSVDLEGTDAEVDLAFDLAFDERQPACLAGSLVLPICEGLVGCVAETLRLFEAPSEVNETDTAPGDRRSDCGE